LLQHRMECMVEEISAGRMLSHSRISENLLVGAVALRLHDIGVLIREWARMVGTLFHAGLEEEVAVTTRFAFGWMWEGRSRRRWKRVSSSSRRIIRWLVLIAAQLGDEVVAMEEGPEEGEHGDPDQADLKPGSD
jgi:hypothetical protein